MRNKKRAAALLFAAMLLTGSIPVYGAQPEENGIISSEAAVECHEQVQNAAAGEKDGEATYASYLNIEETWMELAAGTQSQLQVHTDAPAGTVTYRSADPKIATVDKNGVIRAVSGGNSGSAETDIIVSSGKLSAECTVSVYNTIALSEEDVVLYTKGSNTKQLKAVCSPLGNVTWRSSQPGVATVSEAGKVTAKRAGSTTITATANGVSAECYVTVRKPSVELVSRATVYLKNPQKLDITVQPAAKVKWKSLNTKIATVNTKGVITAKKTGKVTITATANGITKKCRVTVAKPSVTLWNSEVAVFEGSTVSLNADARPAGAVRWKTSNKKTATVDKNGVITGRRAGKVKITAYVGGASATATVRVFKNPYQLNMTKRTLAVGQSASLYVKNLDSGISPSFEGNGQAVSLNAKQGSCRIKAAEKGKSTVEVRFQVYQDGCWASWSKKCSINVVDEGISKQQFSVAVKQKEKLKLLHAGNVSSVTWSSTAPKIAAVDESTGVVTGIKAGNAQIKAQVVYQDGTAKTYSTGMKVSDPKLGSKGMAVAVSGKAGIVLKGVNAYSDITYKSKKSSVIRVSADGTVTPVRRGKAVIEITADGRKLNCPVYVSNPKLKEDYLAVTPGGTSKISVSGLSAKSSVTYKSANPAAASVDAAGTVTGVSCGKSEITVTADGKEFTYLVEVAPKQALDARNIGAGIMSVSQYSQALRMTEGYYDCSSLVFRSYGKNTALLGGTSSWAPTAAGMAEHMVKTGKVLSYSALDVSQLLPGDLIFYGHRDNGRYLGIYHVSMYYGNGLRLEKPMYGYWPLGNIVMIARPVR